MFLQVFPALKKSHNSIYVKLRSFIKNLCLISPISCWRITCFSCHFIRLMNKWQSLHHSQSKVVYQNFLSLWLLQTLTNSFCLQKKTKICLEKSKSYILGFGNGISCSWEWKLINERFAIGWFWLCTWKYFFSL